MADTAVKQCTAREPHVGRLRYSGGRDGFYQCEKCGRSYRKNGQGGLRDWDVPVGVTPGPAVKEEDDNGS